jgi:hypothetical protein
MSKTAAPCWADDVPSVCASIHARDSRRLARERRKVRAATCAGLEPALPCSLVRGCLCVANARPRSRLAFVVGRHEPLVGLPRPGRPAVAL